MGGRGGRQRHFQHKPRCPERGDNRGAQWEYYAPPPSNLDRLQHVDDVVDAASLHLQPRRGLVQRDALHGAVAVLSHEVLAQQAQGLVLTAVRGPRVRAVKAVGPRPPAPRGGVGEGGGGRGAGRSCGLQLARSPPSGAALQMVSEAGGALADNLIRLSRGGTSLSPGPAGRKTRVRGPGRTSADAMRGDGQALMRAHTRRADV